MEPFPQKTDGSDERLFLHDLASPIGVAILCMDAVSAVVEASPTAAADLPRVLQAQKALQKVKTLLDERRQLLIQRGIPSARS